METFYIGGQYQSMTKAAMDLEKKRDLEIVRGIFKNHEQAGGELKFSFKKYAGKVETYHLYDGEVYSIPRMVAKHLNNQCAYPTFEFADNLGTSTRSTHIPGKPRRRFSFEYVSDEELRDES